MQCPHCLVAIHEDWFRVELFAGQRAPLLDEDGKWSTDNQICPACKKAIIRLITIQQDETGVLYENKCIIVNPKAAARPKPSEHVPRKLARDYSEACLVLNDSPQASAALSRRCLQTLIREHAHIKKRDLAQEIQEVIDSNQLPQYLTDQIDGVRHIGNFAAHPTKSESTGEILDVENGEAEWLLNTLEGLFDFYFVKKAETEAKRNALNQKLQDAGKPPMK